MKHNSYMHIWIEAENWSEGEWDIENTNLDVIVTFPNRSKYLASFFTYQNVISLTERYKETGENMEGAYFSASDMVLIDIASRERIYQLIDYLIDNDTFKSVFTRCPDVEIDEDDLFPEDFFEKKVIK
ncbi:hypothetical protein ACIQXI_05610 [Lysinibacillus sp. NPDC097195]|uniref:hypothetical protein n=1 Tax=Lysinibacillus sp. NPDC097195 TaxID=3364141 RepID=UPI00380DD6C3